MARDWVDVVRRNDVVLLQRPVMRRRRSKDSVCAEIVSSRAAKVTPPAGYTRLDGHAVADLHIPHSATRLDDDARTLVAEDDWGLEDEVADAATLPVVHVTAANASLLDVDADVVLVAELRNRAVLEADVLN